MNTLEVILITLFRLLILCDVYFAEMSVGDVYFAEISDLKFNQIWEQEGLKNIKCTIES